jgi:hypothetical protein
MTEGASRLLWIDPKMVQMDKRVSAFEFYTDSRPLLARRAQSDLDLIPQKNGRLPSYDVTRFGGYDFWESSIDEDR